MTLIRLLAARTATELNVADLAAELGIPLTTFRRYLPLFETTYIHHSVAAWSGNISAKVVKRPKVHFVDSGAAATLVGTNALALARPTSTISGQLLETFVAGELARQLTWRRTRGCITGETAMAQKSISSLSRPTADGRVVGVEVKAAVDIGPDALSGLKYLQRRLGDRLSPDS